MAWRTYSLLDVSVVFAHPDVGQYVISDEGSGRVSFSYGADMASNTPTATGYVVVNKMRAEHGAVQLEIPQNSEADENLRKWIRYIKNAPTNRFALGTLTITDGNVNRTYQMVGVVPQKDPDETFDQQSGFRTYNLLFAEYKVA